MGLDLKRLMDKVLGKSVESASAAIPAPSRNEKTPQQLAIPAVEMTASLGRTRDFLADRSKLVSGLGWERLAHMPDWIGFVEPSPSGTMSRISWSGVLGGLTDTFPVVGRMPTSASALLDFAGSRKRAYRYIPGGEASSLDELLLTGQYGEGSENIAASSFTTSSAILKRLSDVWNHGAGEKPISPRRTGRVVMRHPAPPTPRQAGPSLPRRNAGDSTRQAATQATGEGAHFPPDVGKEAGETAEKGPSGLLSPLTKVTSLGRKAIRRLLKTTPPLAEEGTTAASEESTETVSFFDRAEKAPGAPEMPLAGEASERASAPGSAGGSVFTGKPKADIPPPTGTSAAIFSHEVAESVRTIVPDLGKRFPLAGGALVKKVPAEAGKLAASPAGTAGKLFRSLALSSALFSAPRGRAGDLVPATKGTRGGSTREARRGEAIEVLEKVEEKPVGSAARAPLEARLERPESTGRSAGALPKPVPTKTKIPSSAAKKRLAMPMVGPPETAAMRLFRAPAPGAGREDEIPTVSPEGGSGIVSWAMEIVERHAPEFSGIREMLGRLSIPAPLEGPGEKAVEGLEAFPGDLFQREAGRPLSVPGAGTSMGTIEQAFGLPEVTGPALRPMEATQRITSAPGMPLPMPSVALGASGEAVRATRTGGEESPPASTAGEGAFVEPATDSEGQGSPEPSPKLPDLEDLTDEIYRRLMRRLKVEREIRGL